jgi:hypothetical protein
MFLAKKLNRGAGTPAAPVDAQFNYVTMLLHGDGTNGAQNNTFLDSSPNNFTITSNGNTTQGSFSPYGSNWGNYFSGSASYITVPSTLALSTSNYTVEFWFSGSRFEVSWGTSGGYSPFSINSSGAIYFANSSNNAWIYNLDNFIIGDGTWNHYAIVRNSGVVYLYRNGVQVGTSSLPSSSSPNGNVVIGYYDSGAIGYASNFRCVIGTAVYTSAFTPSTAPLTAITNTQLLTCQSNRFKDNSTNNYVLTLTGTVSVQRFNPFGASAAYSTSVIGGSGFFDGSGDYLNTASNAAFTLGSSGNFTVECWVYLNGSQSSSYAAVMTNMANFSSSFAGSWAFTINGLNLRWYNSTGDGVMDFPVVPYQWIHLAAVRSGSVISIYVNGIEVAAQSSGQSYTTAGSLKIGFLTGAAAFKGYITDARVVKGTAVYTTEFTPPTAPLTAITNTTFLANVTNGAIFDNAMMNNLETVGNAQISTSVVKYGTGSLYFDGNGDNLSGPTTPDLNMGTGNFTVECWVYIVSRTLNYPLIFGNNNGSYTAGAVSLVNSNSDNAGYINRFCLSVRDHLNAPTLVASSTNSLNTWYHLAVVRNGTSLVMYRNGTSVASATISSSLAIDWGKLGSRVGGGNWDGAQSYLDGYIDDLRVTKGYARYTTTFTPPTAAFPNTGPY